MLVYKLLDRKYGLKSITERRLRVSRLTELNDPFEFLSVDLSDPQFRKALRATKEALSEKNGLLCFSMHWSNPVLWGHYADKHKGICLGFKMAKEYPKKVDYIEKRLNRPSKLDEDFVKRILFTKFIHWQYEEEYRCYVALEKVEDGHYYEYFSDRLILRKVIIGCESKITRAQISGVLGHLSSQVEVFKVRPAFKEFKVVRNKKESLWF